MDDDYVAEVLAREARDSSQRYQTDGLGAYLPRRPTGNAPKPNTRFLRHLIKETDNHNTALKRKEEREARERIGILRAQSQVDSLSEPPLSTRRDHHFHESKLDRKPDITRGHREVCRDHHRRKGSENDLSQRTQQVRAPSADRDRSRRHRRRDESHDRSSRDHRERRERRDHRGTDRHRDRYESDQKYRSSRDRSPRSRSRSPRQDRTSGRHHSQKYHRRSEPPSDARSSHPRRTRTEHRSERFEREKPHFHRESHSSTTRDGTSPRERKQDSPSTSAAALKTRRDHSEDDSDPLEDLVGPLPPQMHGEDAPPLRSRGRGAYKPSASAIDAHFAPDYDPKFDARSEDEGTLSLNKSSRRPVAGLMTADDDWDMALEALRDRQRWKQKGEERLRAAGVNEETIDRWKKNAAFTGAGSTEGNPENVRWAKKGEGREWDRGKVMDEDGHIDVRPAW